jgi:hypothetical protein
MHGRQGERAVLVASARSNLDLPLTLAWTVVRAPSGSRATPTPADHATTAFTYDTGGDWLLRFTATDPRGDTASCTVHVSADPAIDLLCPDDQSGYEGQTLSLLAQARSLSGTPLTLAWSVDARPAGSTSLPVPADALATRFLLDRLGDWTLRLVAHDGAGGSDACTVRVHADPDVIVACPPDTTSQPFAHVTLAATAASRLGLPLTYRWEIVDAPITSTAALDAPTALATGFTFDVAGNWTYRFTATNSRGEAASCTTRALARSAEAVRVELVWNLDRSCATCDARGGGLDLDLHLADAALAMGHWNTAAPDMSDCDWADCRCGAPGSLCPHGAIDWPPAGDANDPQLDVDHMSDLPGPENINVVRTQVGAQFDVGVHFYGDNTSGVGTNATGAVVRVYCGGALAFESEPVVMGPVHNASSEEPPATDANPLWRVGRITVTPGGCTFERCGAPGMTAACIRPGNAW